MKILILGAAGFIGTNLTLKYLKRNTNVQLVLYDYKMEYFNTLKKKGSNNIEFREGTFDDDTDFDEVVKGIDLVYHMISTTIPATSNYSVADGLHDNVIVTNRLLDACVRQKVGKIVFISSGGAVYGKENNMPLKEDAITNPISSYGIQKISIEKLLYLYNYIYDLDYRIVRLANPFGPYQRPDGRLGVVTTFIYKAINNEPVTIYGDGSVIRDFIYIDDAIDAILNIAEGKGCDSTGKEHKLFNVGSGEGISINEVIKCIEKTLEKKMEIHYKEGRKSDVPVNYLDISLYESVYGKLVKHSLERGVEKTKKFFMEEIENGSEKN